MEFGMPVLIELGEIEACAALCRELELDFVELNMNLPQYQPGQMDMAYLRDVARRYQIGYTIHLDENLNVSDFNPYVAEAYRKTVLETIALAKALGAPVINMHLPRGVYFTLPEKRVYLFDVYREQYLRSMEAFRDACGEAAGGADIRLCVENCDGFTDFQKEAIALLLESPVFALTFDVGHNHGCGGLDEPFILKNRQHLCHMHLHDALGRKNHMALGTGEMDITQYLNLAAQQRCRVVLETKTVAGLAQSVRWVRAHGWR